MYECELDHKEGWTPKNWCFWAVVLKKTLESPLDCKEIQPVHPKGDQSWCSLEGPMLKLKLCPSDAKSWLIGKDADAEKDWGQEEKGATEDEMVGWHHRLNGREFEQTLGDSEEWGSLACCSPRGRKESDVTERLNWTQTPYMPIWSRNSAFLGPVLFFSDLTTTINAYIFSSSVC